MKLISKKEAKELELKRFFTGVPCKNGHVDERMVSTHDCITCRNERTSNKYDKSKSKEYYKKNRDKLLAQQKEYTKKNKDTVREYQAQYRKEHRDDNKAYLKEYYQQNKEESIQKSRIHYNENKDYYAEYNQQYYEDNAEELKSYQKEWYAANQEDILDKKKDYYKENQSDFIARNGKRRAQKIKATPPWFHLHVKEVRNLYHQSALLTEETGVQHRVDHIVPLLGTLVCGLHCISNLRILTAKENNKKGNKFDVS